MSTEWEYKDFVYKYGRNWSPCTIGSDGYTEASARLKFWQESQKYILPELQKWLDDGWEPIGEIGAAGISLHTYFGLPKGDRSCGMLLILVFLTLITFGIFLLLGLGQYAAPVEFRVRMRRRKK